MTDPMPVSTLRRLMRTPEAPEKPDEERMRQVVRLAMVKGAARGWPMLRRVVKAQRSRS